ncbi:MAG: flagellar biosynthetic protein FliQ [Planctomycetaceae bacterium]
MSTIDVVQICRELVITTMLVAAPTVLVSLLVGLVISILQTITSVQEQTLTFAPRLLAVGVVFVVTLPWTLRLVMEFTERMLTYGVEAAT